MSDIWVFQKQMSASSHAPSLVHAPVSPPVAWLSNNTFTYSDVAFVLCRGLDSVLFRETYAE